MSGPTNVANIGELLKRATELAGISDTQRLDAEILLGHALGVPRSYLFAWPEKVVDADARALFEALLKRRRQGEPIAYLIGRKEFWSLPLAVNSSALIPRPETELLVQRALDLLVGDRARVLDLGTGTGAIALALATERPQWDIVAVDQSAAAIALAEENRRNLGLDNVRIVQSNWFDDVPSNVRGQKFELILANPPYLDAHDEHLAQGDVRFEPRAALVAGDDGLADLKIIIEGARGALAAGGWVLLEHGFAQGAAVRRWLTRCGYRNIATHRDLAGMERVSEGEWLASVPVE